MSGLASAAYKVLCFSSYFKISNSWKVTQVKTIQKHCTICFNKCIKAKAFIYIWEGRKNPHSELELILIPLNEQYPNESHGWQIYSCLLLNFRYQNCFHGVDLCQLREQALAEYLRQPIVDTFDIEICLAKSIRYSLDFLQATERDLYHIGMLFYFNFSTLFSHYDFLGFYIVYSLNWYQKSFG